MAVPREAVGAASDHEGRQLRGDERGGRTTFARMVAATLFAVTVAGDALAVLPAVYVQGRADFGVTDAGTASAMGDLNGDGRPDFVMVASANDTVSVLLGQLDGAFRPIGVPQAVGVEPVAAAVADFNTDNRLDAAVVNITCPLNVTTCPPGSVSILLGRGDGTFEPAVEYATAAAPVSIVVEDVDSDGRLDLLIAAAVSRVDSGSPGLISVLRGNADGTFRTHQDFASGNGVAGLQVGRFDADTAPDVIALTHPSLAGHTLALLRGRGDGTFFEPAPFDIGTDPIALAAGDFDADGRLDLGVSSSPSQVVVLIGRGDGTFQSPVSYATGLGTTHLITGDLDEDGRADLIVGGASAALMSGALEVLLGRGDGTFQAARAHVSGTRGPLFVGDFNADVHRDVAIGTAGGGVRILLGRGGGWLARDVRFATAPIPNSVAAGDFDHDGRTDLAVTSETGDVIAVLRGHGRGTFGPGRTFATGVRPVWVHATDLDADGHSDLVILNTIGNSLSVLKGRGDGTFAPRVDFATGAFPVGGAVVDFNTDGRQDVAVTNYGSNSVSVFLGRGDGTFAARVDFATGLAPYGVAAADLDGDGRLDLAVANSGTPVTLPEPGLISILRGNGDGTFQPATELPLDSLRPLLIAAGDLTGDGYADLVVASRLSELSIAAVLIGDGQGAFSGPRIFGTGVLASDVSIADFDGDGRRDVAIVNSGSNTVALLRVDAQGELQRLGTYGTAVAPTAMTIADFDGDGEPDIAVAAAGSNAVSVLASTVPPTSDFALAVASTEIIANRGQTISQALNVSPVGSFGGTVTLSCSGAPARVICSVSPDSANLDATAAANATVTITTFGPTTTARARAPERGPDDLSGFAWLAATGLISLASFLRDSGLGQLLGALRGLFLAVLGVLLLASCGGGGAGARDDGGTAPGTYTLVVSAGSGAVTHTINLTLTVR